MFVALLSLFILFFFSGYAVLAWQKLRVPFLIGSAFCISFGMLIQFFMFLILQRLSLALVPALLLMLVGLYAFVKNLRGNERTFYADSRPEVYFGLVIVIALYAISLVSEPISGFDPTAIWFLQSKMIYSAKSLGLEAGWLDPSLGASFHTDYPKLFAALTGVCMTILGHWDEYLPKLSFLFLLVPALFYLASFYERKLNFLFLLFAFLGVTGNWLWTGYLDGYLVFYFGLSILLTERYLRLGKKIDLYSALATAGVLTNLKNEGVVMGLAFGLGAIIILKPKLKQWWLGILVFLPAAFWFALKHFWNLQNYLQQTVANPSHSFWARVNDGASIHVIFNALLIKNHPVRDAILILIVLKIVLRFGFKVNVQATRSVPLWIGMSSVIYFACLFSVYLVTPFDLDWHLTTSVARTTLPFELAAYLIAFMSIASVDRETPLLLKRSD